MTIALRMCARSVGKAMTPLGLFYRRIRSRIGGSGAVKATAHKLACLVYRMLRYGQEYVAQSMAPILHARPNTVGRFTDLPILMWYEVVPTARGQQYRYSVIFTNEDGGTETDRLMATWGRTITSNR